MRVCLHHYFGCHFDPEFFTASCVPYKHPFSYCGDDGDVSSPLRYGVVVTREELNLNHMITHDRRESAISNIMETLFSDRAIVSDHMETLFSDRAIVSDYLETLFSVRAIVSVYMITLFSDRRSSAITWKQGSK